ncbi:MAG: DUF1572 family protein [Bacteroidia bacterium]
MANEQSILPLLRDEVKRRLFEESVPRIKKCLNLLSHEQNMATPQRLLVSIGNLTIHCIGNAGQWIGAALGGLPDGRQRSSEFDARHGPDAEGLAAMLDSLQAEIEPVIDSISLEEVEKKYNIQGFEEYGIAVLVHVVEHFSYHTGQISWFTKLLLNTDLKYYDGKNLNDTVS